MPHIPVLYQTVLTHATVSEGELWIDCTLGRGGHCQGLLERGARVIGLDRDEQALAETQERLQPYIRSGHLTLLHQNFRQLKEILSTHQLEGVSGIIADLGVSSPQLDQAERGFSFMASGPLDMRMDRSQGLSALEWIIANEYQHIARILRQYGEEPRAQQLAREIKAWSEEGLTDTLSLARRIESATPMKLRRKLKKHPATRVFQALRIAVNDELGALEQLLEEGPSCLELHGRLLLISFHSLEDRLIKQRFRALSEPPPPPRRGLPPPPHEPPAFNHHPRKGVIASEEERLENPRARSARLRVLTRIRSER